MDTIKVKPWHPSQGDHVVINAADFDPAVHRRFGDEVAAKQANEQHAERFRFSQEMSIEGIKAVLTAKGVKFRANASREALVALLAKE